MAVSIENDSDFLSQLLQSDAMSDIENRTDSEGSESDIDLDTMVRDSDEDEMFNTDTQKPSTSDSTQYASPRGATVSDETTNSVQSAINIQILEQLDRLGKRLDNIEKSSQCKKTSDKTKIKKTKSKQSSTSRKTETVPQSAAANDQILNTNIGTLRQDAFIQAQVQQRLHELANLANPGNSEKIKSQRGGKVEILVKNRVKWPHEFILSGLNKERITYDQLNVTQWVAGFARTIKEESNAQIRESMLDYLINIMDDANDFSWSSAKSSHAVLLCRMEQGEVKDFSDFNAIERIRRANAQRHVPVPQNQNAQTSSVYKKSNNTRSMPCNFYNQDSCMHSKSHETRGVWYKHICSSCFANSGKTFAHPESACKNKNKLAKNE